MKALKKYFPLISLVCGVAAFIMIFLPAVEIPGYDWNGLKVCFGDKDFNMKFSICSTATYLLAIAGGVLAYYGAKNSNKKFQYAAIACFAVAAIFFFIAPNFIQWKGVPESAAKEARKLYDAAIGSILGALFCLVGAASTVCDVVIKE